MLVLLLITVVTDVLYRVCKVAGRHSIGVL